MGARRDSADEDPPRISHAEALVVFLAVVAFAIWQHWRLPDVRRADTDLRDGFSAERARDVIKDLGYCGFKYIGSHANEVCAVETIQRHIYDVARSHEDRVQVSQQSASGHFYLNFLDGLTSIYRNLTNIVVHVKSPRKPSCTLLISSHFDSSFGSPAASDSNAEIAIMVEMIRLLLHTPELQSKAVDVIFNFNGGEEMLLQASHGFMTSHPWGGNICAFINLESMGSGGRELLFQVGPKHSWIVEAYKKYAPRPFAQSLISLLFQTGVIPGETDYRIYRDFGDLPGADFAIISNDYVYHTTRDDLEHVDFRTVQRYGETAFGLARGMMDVLEHGPPSGAKASEASVFFDVAGSYLISYSTSDAFLLNLVVVVTSFLSVLLLAKTSLTTLLFGVGKLLGCWIRSILLTVMCSLVVAMSPAAVVASGHPELVPLLYTAPAVYGFLGGRNKDKEARKADPVSEGALASILLATICLGLSMLHPVVIAASYFFLLWVVPPLIGEVIALFIRPHYFSCWVSAGCFIIPWLITAQIWVVAIDVLCPLTMRSGTTIPGDVVLAAIHSLIFSTCITFSGRFLSHISWNAVGSKLTGTFVFGLLLSGLYFPYSYDKPKRIYMQHIARSKFHWDLNGSSNTHVGEVPMTNGIWTVAFDWNGISTLQKYAPLCFPENSVRADESLGPYGELPNPFPIKPFVAGGLWAVTHPPDLPSKLKLGISLHEQDGYCGLGSEDRNAVCQKSTANVDLASKSSSRILHFSVRGGPHIRIAIERRPYIKSWSLGYIEKKSDSDKLDTLPPVRPDCDCYWILFSEGGQDPTRGSSEAFNFSVGIELGDEPRDLRLDIWATHLEVLSPEIKNYTARAPYWVNFAGWVSELQVHTISVPASKFVQ